MIMVLHGSEVDAHPDLMDAVFRLRYEHFVLRRNWSLPTRAGRDIDQYDAADAAYVVALADKDGSIQGYARLNQTLRSSLLADLFPHLIETGEAPRGPTLFEGTRFALSPGLRSRAESRRVRSQICLAAAQWVLDQGGTHLQTVVDYSAFPTFVEMTLHTLPLGLHHDYGGGPRVKGGGRCIAFRWELAPPLLEDLQAYGRDADLRLADQELVSVH